MSITRKEAIEGMEAIRDQMFNNGNSKWTEVCDMAIEALKYMSDPCSECQEFSCDGCNYKERR